MVRRFRQDLAATVAVIGAALAIVMCSSPEYQTNGTTCSNRVLDDGEADVDCGGPSSCDRCKSGSVCRSNDDCVSGVCSGSLCRVSTGGIAGNSGAPSGTSRVGSSNAASGARPATAPSASGAAGLGPFGVLESVGGSANQPAGGGPGGGAAAGAAIALATGGIGNVAGAMAASFGGTLALGGRAFGAAGGVGVSGGALLGGTSGRGSTLNALGGTSNSLATGLLAGMSGAGGNTASAGANSIGGAEIQGGTGAKAGATATAGDIANGGNAGRAGSSAIAGANSAGAAGAANLCTTHTAVTAASLITDFSEFTSGTSWTNGAVKAWGGTSILAGTTFIYGTTGVALTVSITPGGRARLVSSLANGNFVGFGLYFGVCANASASTGVSAVIGGTLGNATLKWQLQTSGNVPVNEVPGRGECVYTSTATMWQDCMFSTVVVSGVNTTVGTFSYSFSQFTGGKPQATVDKTSLLGTQWQIECQSSGGCSVDVTIDDVKFR